MLITISGPDQKSNIYLCLSAQDYVNDHYSNIKAMGWVFTNPSDSLPARIKPIDQILTFKKEIMEVELDKDKTLWDCIKSRNYIIFVPYYYSDVLIDQILDIDSSLISNNNIEENYELTSRIIQKAKLPIPDLSLVYIPDYNESDTNLLYKQSTYKYLKTMQLKRNISPFLKFNENPPIYIRTTTSIYVNEVDVPCAHPYAYQYFFADLSTIIKNHPNKTEASDQINNIFKQLLLHLKYLPSDSMKENLQTVETTISPKTNSKSTKYYINLDNLSNKMIVDEKHNNISNKAILNKEEQNIYNKFNLGQTPLADIYKKFINNTDIKITDTVSIIKVLIKILQYHLDNNLGDKEFINKTLLDLNKSLDRLLNLHQAYQERS